MRLLKSWQTDMPKFYAIAAKGEIVVTAKTFAEAKLALKELQADQQALKLTQHHAADPNRNRRSAGISAGISDWLGHWLRRDPEQDGEPPEQTSADQAARLEEQRQQLEAKIAAIDKAIRQVELTLGGYGE